MTKGNHETKKKLEVLKKNYNIKILDEDPKIINNVGFFSPKYITVGPLREEENKTLESIFYNYYKINKKSKLNIFLTHIPPTNTKIGDSSPFFPFIGGNLSTKIFLETKKIDLTLVGHIHESSGEIEKVGNLENLVLNVGKTYKIIEIDKEFKLKILN
jgi:Icc-related predicted phosphoesterase